MDAIHAFLAQRRSDLVAAQQYGSNLLQHRSLALAGDLPSNVLLTALATVALAHLLLACLTHRGRKVVAEAVDTTLAVILIVLLVAIVLGLPIAVAYLSFKALLYLLRSAAALPAVASAAAALRSAAGL